ncbi:MAG: hypothetical protein EA352_00860, partial [Gemmatimonadales bacterium]
MLPRPGHPGTPPALHGAGGSGPRHARFRTPDSLPMIQQRPPWVHALCAAGAALLLYAITLAPTTWFWDT